MNCKEAEDFLDAYLDGELESSQKLELEQHLGQCSECRAALEERRQFRSFFAANAPQYKAPEELRVRIATITQQKKSTWWRLTLICAAALLAVGLVIAWTALYPNGDREKRLGAQAVSDYLRAALVDHLCDIVSPDPQVVKPWLSAKLNFSPPVVDLAGSGYQMRGGRIDIIQNRRVAALVYRDANESVTLFIWPETRRRLKGTDQVRNGVSVCTWNAGDFNFIAVSKLGETQLDEFVDRFREKM
jgi:anti-sigma factor (TIGR02949 family)